jgi:hypothetical protein
MATNAIRRWLDAITGRCHQECGKRQRPGRCRPRVRQLEDRTVPTTFNITNGDVQGLISAITTANSDGQFDVINLAQGGSYTFASSNNVTDNGSNVLPAILSQDLYIEGNRAILAGPGFARFFDVQPGATLLLRDATLGGGTVHGVQGGPAQGGAIYNHRGNLTLENVNITGAAAARTSGGGVTARNNLQQFGGDGGRAQGGGIYSAGGHLTLVSCNVYGRAVGGKGGEATAGGPNGGSGGAASGGAVWLSGGQATFSGCSINGRASGGAGAVGAAYYPQSGAGGAGGSACAGGLFASGATVVIANCNFVGTCFGGKGGDAPGGRTVSGHYDPSGGFGGRGGSVQGGGACCGGGQVALFGANFTSCYIQGGNGGNANGLPGLAGAAGSTYGKPGHAGSPGGKGGHGGAGGHAQGGGLFAVGTVLTVHQATVAGCTANAGSGGQAAGGRGGAGGTGGAGSTASFPYISPGTGGPGGAGGAAGTGGDGGAGEGGGLYLSGTSLSLDQVGVSSNAAGGGVGGAATGGSGGAGGPRGPLTPHGARHTTPSGAGGGGGTGGQGGKGDAACGGGLYVASGSTAILCDTTVQNDIAGGGPGGSVAGGNGGAGSPTGPAGNAGTAGSPGSSANPDVCGATSVPVNCLGAIQALPNLTALQGWSTGMMKLATFSGGPAGQSAGSYSAMVFWGDGTNSATGGRSANVRVVADTAGNVEVFGRHTYAPPAPGPVSHPPNPCVVALWLPGQDSAEAVIPVSVAANVTDQVTTTTTTPKVNPATGLYTGAITFTNPAGASDIKGQFDVLLAHLPPGVSVKSATVTIGTATYRVAVNRDNPQVPFLEIPAADLSDLAGGESITLSVTFKDPLGTAIVLAPGLFAAPAGPAP